MAKRVIDESTLISLADAVRAMTGITDPLTLDDMIRHIQETGGSVTTNTAEGNPIQIADCMTRKLHGLTLYGKTIQNGTPSPSAPLALNSAGADGNIIVNVDTQTLNVFTPYGLPGIPVPSDGNYTDANGQQWVCDEIDFARGKYIQRINTYTPPNNAFVVADGTGYPVGNSLFFRTTLTGVKSTVKYAICSHLPCDTGALNRDIDGFYISGAGAYCRIKGVSNLDEFHRQMNGAKFVFILATPIETDLAVEELVTYAKLHTNYPQTVIYNDADAWMSVKYVVDVATEADYQDALREMGVDV